MEIDALRQEIDQIDRQIIALFCQRMDVAARVADYKKERGLPVLVPAREEAKLRDVAEIAGPQMASYTQELFRSLFSLSRAYQAERNEASLVCGLLGQKLGHSYSPAIHQMLGKYSYRLMEVPPQELESFLEQGAFSGINVTIPYKKAVLPYCKTLSQQAKLLGSVNTIIRQTDGSLYGDNTDYYGFSKMLRRSGLDVGGKKVLVLGSGGASATVQAVLHQAGAQVVVISRQGENNYENLHLHQDAYALVNTTPVGMYPLNGQSPVDLMKLPNLKGVLDLIYNPARTALLLQAQQLGLVTENGLYMLVAQAKKAAELFTGRAIADSVLDSIYARLSYNMENIVLIGMPGSGKSSIAVALGDLLGREVADSDALIEEMAGMPIPDIFSRQGEDAFRELETQALQKLCARSGIIIATGGGCVKREENWSILRQNSKIYWILRDLELLPLNGRPISQQTGVQELFAQRKPLYEALANHSVENNTTVLEAAQIIAQKHTGGIG